MDVALEHADLLGDAVLEVVSQLLPQAAEGGGAEHVLLEPFDSALPAGGTDDQVQPPEVGEGAQDLLDERRPEEARSPGQQYLLAAVRLTEQLAPPLRPLSYLPLRAIQKGSRVLPVPPQDKRPPDYRVEHVGERLAGEPEHHGANHHHRDRAERSVAAKEHDSPPEREEP